MSFWEMTHEQRAALAESDSSGFEELWKAEVAKVPGGDKMMWSAQAKMKRIKNPIERCNQSFAMMASKFEELKAVLNDNPL